MKNKTQKEREEVILNGVTFDPKKSRTMINDRDPANGNVYQRPILPKDIIDRLDFYIDQALSQKEEEVRREVLEKIKKMKIGDLGHYEKFAQLLDGGEGRDRHDQIIDDILQSLTKTK